jgi:hypothetical protein
MSVQAKPISEDGSNVPKPKLNLSVVPPEEQEVRTVIDRPKISFVTIGGFRTFKAKENIFFCMPSHLVVLLFSRRFFSPPFPLCFAPFS